MSAAANNRREEWELAGWRTNLTKRRLSLYSISFDGTSITCHVCGLTSWHPADVKELFCSKCKTFHEG